MKPRSRQSRTSRAGVVRAFPGFAGKFVLGFFGCLPAATRESFARLIPSNFLSPQTEQTILSLPQTHLVGMKRLGYGYAPWNRG